jgi:hypothetical protein
VKKLCIIILIIIVCSFYGCDPMSDKDQTRDTSINTAQETGTENTSGSDEETTMQDVSDNTETSASITEDTTVEDHETTQSGCIDTSTYSTETTDEIILDKTYHDDRFAFEFKYPSIWSLVEERKIDDSPEHGAFIFIDDNDVDQTPIVNHTDLKNYILIYGSESSISIDGVKATGEFITDDGATGIVYYRESEGMLLTSIVFSKNSVYGYGYDAFVYVSKELNDKFGDVITRILKSIKLPK